MAFGSGGIEDVEGSFSRDPSGSSFSDFDDSEREDPVTTFTRKPLVRGVAAATGTLPILGAVNVARDIFGRVRDFIGSRPATSSTTPGTGAARGVPSVSGVSDGSGGGGVPGVSSTPTPGVNLGGGGNALENLLLGKPGEFGQVPTDPNQEFFSRGQRQIAQRFLDPSQDPILQRALRGISSRLGITAQGGKAALASDAVGAHSARAFDVFNRGFAGTRPITSFTPPGEGLLGAFDERFEGRTPDFIRNLNPFARGGQQEGGSFFGQRTPDFIRDLNPFG